MKPNGIYMANSWTDKFPAQKAGACLLVLILCALSFSLEAGASVITTLGQAGSVTVDGNRSDWAGLSAYPDDATGETGIGAFDVDWLRITVANSDDGNTLYLRLQQANGASFDSFPAFYNIFVDTDENRSTGYIGGSSELALGADYLIQGNSIFSFSGGTQTTFSWSPEGAASVNNGFSDLDIEMSMATSLLGSPDGFHFLLFGDNGLNGNTPDYYPGTADQGASGGVFAYDITIVPEPGTLSIMLMGLGLISLRKKWYPSNQNTTS